MDFLIKVKEINKKVLESLSNADIVIEDVFKSFNIISVAAKSEGILNSFDFIESINVNEPYEIQNHNLKIVPNIRHNKLKKLNYLGNNTKVAVIDSGMNAIHGLDILENVVCSNSKDSTDAMVRGNLHGTIVGAIVKEFAPWSKLINIKIADDYGNIDKKSVIKALEYLYINDIKIANMSIGKQGDCPSNCLVCGIVETMRDNGFIIVAAIGNYGHEGEGITGCPGHAKKSISVGAVNANKKLADYSSTAKPDMRKPDILAPGTCIIDKKTYTGTSFAAPVITGIITALAEKFDLEYIVECILKTAQGIGLPHNKQGFGLLSIERILEVLDNEGIANQG